MGFYYDAFLSHSTSDRKWARDFANSLRDRGVRVFYDEWNVRPGVQIEDTIKAGLKDSHYVVVLLDSSNTNSPWASFEVGAALGIGKKVLPVVAPDVRPENLPEPLQHLRSIRMTSPSEAAGRVAKLLQSSASSQG